MREKRHIVKVSMRLRINTSLFMLLKKLAIFIVWSHNPTWQRGPRAPYGSISLRSISKFDSMAISNVQRRMPRSNDAAARKIVQESHWCMGNGRTSAGFSIRSWSSCWRRKLFSIRYAGSPLQQSEPESRWLTDSLISPWRSSIFFWGAIDNSGMRFFYTSRLRKYDAGVLEVGLEYSDRMAIPPGQPNFELTGYCTPECTDLLLPNRGITIFASQLHSHLTGRQLFTSHLREGVELGIVNLDRHYSPHWQEIRPVEPTRVLPVGEEWLLDVVELS